MGGGWWYAHNGLTLVIAVDHTAASVNLNYAAPVLASQDSQLCDQQLYTFYTLFKSFMSDRIGDHDASSPQIMSVFSLFTNFSSWEICVCVCVHVWRTCPMVPQVNPLSKDSVFPPNPLTVESNSVHNHKEKNKSNVCSGFYCRSPPNPQRQLLEEHRLGNTHVRLIIRLPDTDSRAHVLPRVVYCNVTKSHAHLDLPHMCHGLPFGNHRTTPGMYCWSWIPDSNSQHPFSWKKIARQARELKMFSSFWVCVCAAWPTSHAC